MLPALTGFSDLCKFFCLSVIRARIWHLLILLPFASSMGIQAADAGSGIPVRFSPKEISNELHIFDKEGTLCGVGEYKQRVSQDELLQVELLLNIHGKSTLRQVIQMKHNEVLEPISFSHEYILEKITKRYKMDFESGCAVRSDQNGGSISKKEATLEFEGAKTFAGVMLILVALNFPENECELDLQSITFTPEPKVIKIRMLKQTTENILIGDQKVTAVKYLVCPVLPAIVRVFIGDTHDQRIWLSQSTRPRFLRFEGTLEPGGPSFRIELQKKETAERSVGPIKSSEETEITRKFIATGPTGAHR